MVKVNSKKTLFGIIMLVLAGLLILKGFGLPISIGIFGLSFWETVWAVVLTLVIVSSIINRHLFPLVFSIAGLVYVIGGHWFIPDLSPAVIFPAAFLIFIGLEALVPRRWHFNVTRDENGKHINAEYRTGKDEDNNEVFIDSDNNNVEVNFGSTVKYFENNDFVESNLESNFGAVKAYYDKVQMRGTEAYIHAEVNFGQIEIYVPKAWRVNLSKSNAFGSVRESGKEEWDGEHTVNIRAEANFGEIRLIHV